MMKTTTSYSLCTLCNSSLYSKTGWKWNEADRCECLTICVRSRSRTGLLSGGRRCMQSYGAQAWRSMTIYPSVSIYSARLSLSLWSIYLWSLSLCLSVVIYDVGRRTRDYWDWRKKQSVGESTTVSMKWRRSLDPTVFRMFPLHTQSTRDEKAIQFAAAIIHSALNRPGVRSELQS